MKNNLPVCYICYNISSWGDILTWFGSLWCSSPWSCSTPSTSTSNTPAIFGVLPYRSGAISISNKPKRVTSGFVCLFLFLFFFLQNKALKCRSNSTAVISCINSPLKTNVRPVVLSVVCSADLSQKGYFLHLHRAAIYKYLLIKLYREGVKLIN